MLLLSTRRVARTTNSSSSRSAGGLLHHQQLHQLHHPFPVLLQQHQQQCGGGGALQQQRPPLLPCVAAATAAGGGRPRARNAILDIERDLLPGGQPNTPWRRLKLRIQTCVSVQGLTRLYSRNRHKTSVWRPMHSAGVLMRVGGLLYYRLLATNNSQPLDPTTSQAVAALLALAAPDLTPAAGVTRVMDGARLAQLVVMLSRLQPPLQERALLDPLLQELGRGGGMKLPHTAPDLLAQLAAALARLDWREQQLWLAIAAAASASLQAQAQRREAAAPVQQQHQQQPWRQDSWQQSDAEQEQEFDDDGAPPPPVFDDDGGDGGSAVLSAPTMAAASAAGAAAAAGQQQLQEEWAPPQGGAAWRGGGPRKQPAVWLSADYPKMAAALAAVGWQDAAVLQLLGSEAVPALPLLELQELASLAGAYAAVALPHPQLVPALAQQLLHTARRTTSSSSSRGWRTETAALVHALYALQQLGWPAAYASHHHHPQPQQQQQQQQLLQLLQARVVRLGSSGGSNSNTNTTDTAAALAQSAVRVLQLLEAAACWDAAWCVSPLQQWACNAVAAAGLDALPEQQLQEAAVALAGLHGHHRQAAPSAAPAAASKSQAAAAAAMQALAVAAAARAQDVSAGTLASVLWAAVLTGVRDTMLAEVAVEAAAAPDTQHQQQRVLLLSPGQQARLVDALQQLGRQDLVDTVLQRLLLQQQQPPPVM